LCPTCFFPRRDFNLFFYSSFSASSLRPSSPVFFSFPFFFSFKPVLFSSFLFQKPPPQLFFPLSMDLDYFSSLKDRTHFFAQNLPLAVLWFPSCFTCMFVGPPPVVVGASLSHLPSFRIVSPLRGDDTFIVFTQCPVFFFPGGCYFASPAAPFLFLRDASTTGPLSFQAGFLSFL